MMPIPLFPEPADFDATVRQRGLRFLADKPNPTRVEWEKHSFWQVVLPKLQEGYHGVCNYCSVWIPHSTGTHSIDHFQNKKNHPKLAYEWSNFRYACTRFNSRKGVKTILDPAEISLQTFVLNFDNFFVEASPIVSDPPLLKLAAQTISILKLNEDSKLVKERFDFFQDYKTNQINFDYLKRRAPFIAYELERQGLK